MGIQNKNRMVKSIDQVKQELLALYKSEKAVAQAHTFNDREALLSEAMEKVQPLLTKTDLLTTLVEQAETMVLPVSQLDSFAAWLRSNIPTYELENYGIYLDYIPKVELQPGYPYLFVNTGTTRLHGSLDQPVTATFVGAWTVDVRQATVHASQDAHIHVGDDIAEVNGYAFQPNDVPINNSGTMRETNLSETSPLSKQERELREALADRLRQSGIEVIDNVEEGQRVLDEANALAKMQAKSKITDTVRFFRTPSDETYGFTINGKIYVDTRIATAETPIHEYAHLWASLMRRENPSEWAHIVSLMKDTPVWDQVKRRYSSLKTDNEIADEVLAQYSGRRGAERLRKEMAKSGYATAALQTVKEVLARFWEGIANMLKIRFTTAEEVVDRVLFDLLRGYNPYAQKQQIEVQQGQEQANFEARTSGAIRHQFVGERGAAKADEADEATLRMDNLSVARQMEAAGKDAKAIKYATGWERGTDHLWRYEIGDFDTATLHRMVTEEEKKKERLSAHLKALIDKEQEFRHKVFPDAYFNEFDNEQRLKWDAQHLAAIAELSDLSYEIGQLKEDIGKFEILTNLKTVIGKDSELLKYYPFIGETTIRITNHIPYDMAGHYSQDSGGIITLNKDELHQASVLNHEVQHAIQYLEGFSKGGSRASIRRMLDQRLSNLQELTDYAKELQAKQIEYKKLAAHIGYVYERLMRTGEDWAVERAIDLYWEAMNTLDNDEHSKLKNEYPQGLSPSEIGKAGYHREQAIAELNRLSDFYAHQIPESDRQLIKAADALSEQMDGKSDIELYYALVGEVESRNVQKRMGMSPSERRASLASETEDVARDHQIIWEDNLGKNASEIAKEDRRNVSHRHHR